MMNEEKKIKKRSKDLDYLSQKRQTVCYSDFLNTHEYSSYLTQKHSYSCDTVLFTEIVDLERQMIAFNPDALNLYPEFPVSCLEIIPQNIRFCQEFSHRDILGVLMSLGLERKLIGDIFVDGSRACFLVHNRVKQFLMDEFKQIKRTEVYLKELESIPKQFENHFDDMRCSVASMRLDCIVAECGHFSRSNAERHIKQGMVFINSKEVLQSSNICKSGDKISIRGIGKFIICDQLGESRKGKIILNIKKYC